MSLSSPEKILQKLGADNPQDINLQYLCEECNLTIEYASDMSADAEIIIAPNHHGIITINQNQHPYRQRFSIAHELGHWHLHRKQGMFACDTSHGHSRSFFDMESGKEKERQADRFAADLLMPSYMLKPLVKGFSEINFSCIKNLSETFKTSISATAIQLVTMSEHPILIAVFSVDGQLCYFKRSTLLNENLWPTKFISKGMYAFDAKQSKGSRCGPVSADEWFENIDGDIEVYEESTYYRKQIISIISDRDCRLLAE